MGGGAAFCFAFGVNQDGKPHPYPEPLHEFSALSLRPQIRVTNLRTYRKMTTFQSNGHTTLSLLTGDSPGNIMQIMAFQHGVPHLGNEPAAWRWYVVFIASRAKQQDWSIQPRKTARSRCLDLLLMYHTDWSEARYPISLSSKLESTVQYRPQRENPTEMRSRANVHKDMHLLQPRLQ